MTGFTISNPKILNKNSLVGSFDLQMPSGLIVRGAMLFEKNNRRWVNFPSKEWTDQSGVKKYFPLLEFASREVADRFQAQVLPIAEQALIGGLPEAERRARPPVADAPPFDDDIPFGDPR
jgi:hypothetical protein